MSRGSLIWPFVAEIGQIDTRAMESAGDYDHVFGEPVSNSSTDLSVKRKERIIRIPCQFETEITSFQIERTRLTGDDPNTSVKCVFHFGDLEDMGLIDSEGRAKIRKNDRLIAVLSLDNMVVQRFNDSPMYATEIQPRSFGLSSIARNLLLVSFTSRAKSTIDIA